MLELPCAARSLPETLPAGEMQIPKHGMTLDAAREVTIPRSNGCEDSRRAAMHERRRSDTVCRRSCSSAGVPHVARVGWGVTSPVPEHGQCAPGGGDTIDLTPDQASP